MADVISSIASIPNTDENFSEVYWVVRRENGNMIERMAPRQITSQYGDDVVTRIQHQIRLDSVVTYNSSATIRTGLSHLEGETVSVLGDGKVLDDEVVSGGSITASSVHTYGIVGLPFYSDLETLDLNYQMDTGNSKGVKKKTGNVAFSFVESKPAGQIGQDFDNLFDAFSHLIVSQNSSELVFVPEDYSFEGVSLTNPSAYSLTGTIRRPLNARWNKGGRVCYRQNEPLSVHLTSIVPEVTDGNPV